MSALGSLVVKLALEHAEYVQGLDKSEQAALKFALNAQKNFDQAANSVQGFLTDTAKNVAGAVVAFTGITSAISNTQNAIDILDGLDKAAQRTGSRVEDLSRVEQATRAVGESFGPVEQAITRLAKGLSSFDDGSNDAFRALEALNVQARDTNGNVRTSAEVFIDVTKALQGYENSANKVAIANALFGKSGAELIPTLNDIAEGVDKFSGASALSAQRAGLFNDAMAKTRLLIDNVYNGLAVELLPTLLTIVGAVNSNTNAFGSFQGAGAGVSAVLKGIAIAGFTVAHTFKQLGTEIGARAAQIAAFVKLDFDSAKFIGKSFIEDAARARSEYYQFINTILNGDKAIAQTVQNGGLKKTLDFTLQMPAATSKSASATKQQVSESQRFIDALTNEASQLGKTTFEIKRMEAARLGVLGTTGAIIDRIENETVAAKKLEEQLSRVRSITESVKTAEERFADTQRELNDLLRLPQGGLSIETYNRALKSAQDELNNTRSAAKNTFNDVSQFAIQAQRNIQDAFSDGLFRAFDGDLKGMVDSFKRAIQQMIAQAISADLLGALFGKSQGLGQTGVLLDSFQNVLSGGSRGVAQSGSATAQAPSLLSGLTNLGGIFKDGFSSLKNVFGGAGLSGAGRNAFTGASFLGLGAPGSAFASGAGLSSQAGAASLGTSFAAVAAPLLAAAVATSVLRSFAGEKRLGGGFGKALNVVGDIPILGDFLPVVPLINSLFGRGPLKQKETNLIGNFTAEDFQGITSTKFKAQGGLVVGDKVERVKIDTDTGKAIDEVTGKLKPFADEMSKASREIGLFLDSSIKNISSSFRSIAGDLDISTAAIDNFSASINIATEKGKGFTDEQLAEEIGKVSDAMALSLVPSLNELSKSGESASETLQRIGSEFNALLSVGTSLGKTLAETKAFLSGVSFEARTAFVDAAGGLESLASKTGFFNDNFLSAQEQLAPTIETVTKKLGELGVGFVDTNEEFKKLVQSQDLTTEAGRNMYIALLDIAPMFKQITDATGNLGLTVEKVTEQIQKATEEQIRIATRRAELAARERKEALQNEQLKATQEAQNALRESAIGLRDALLRAGNAAALLSNEFVVKNTPINKDADFGIEIAKANAKLATDLIGELSAIALEVNDVKSVIAALTRTAVSPTVVKPIADSIRNAITGGSNSEAMNKSINRLVNVLAVNQARNGIDRLGQGIAEVLGARREFNDSRRTESVNGRVQFGNDVIEYAKAIDGLNKSFGKGEISAEQHQQALDGLAKAMGSNANLLNNTEAQFDRIRAASNDLAKSGLNSIGFYFGNISKKAKELNQEASELQTPLGKVSDAIGRFKSVAFVFGESVKAVRDGLEDFDPVKLSGLEKAGGQLSKAGIVSDAAKLASEILNTQGGAQAQQLIGGDPLFSGSNARDLSLLIEGITAFDPESFEKSFTKIADALNKNKINEAQFAKLFNIALDSFEGLSTGVGKTAGSLEDLRRSAKSAADSLLVDKKVTVLSPQQQLKAAEQQFNELIKRARSGDTSVSGQLEGAARTLLEAGQASLSNQTDLFGFVQASLRSVEGVSGTQRLEVNQKILKELENMNKRLDDQDKTNLRISAQMASINSSTADTLDRWEKLGMPPVRS